MDDPMMCKKLPSGMTLRIYRDESPESPRGWSNVGEMYGWHRKYGSPDKLPNRNTSLWDVLAAHVPELRNDGESLAERHTVREAIQLANDGGEALVLPLFMHDHGSVGLSHTNCSIFTDPWDSGLFGIHLLARNRAFEEFMGVTVENWRERARKVLDSELNEYQLYLDGQVWGFVVTDPKTGERMDSCWSFYGRLDEDLIRQMAEHWDKADQLPEGQRYEDLPDAQICEKCGRATA